MGLIKVCTKQTFWPLNSFFVCFLVSLGEIKGVFLRDLNWFTGMTLAVPTWNGDWMFLFSVLCCVSLDPQPGVVWASFTEIFIEMTKKFIPIFSVQCYKKKNMNELLPNLIHCLRREGTGLQSLEPEFRPRATSIQSLPYSAFQKHQQNKPTRAFQ